MTKKIILVVASDFQAICAFEYLKRNNYDSCVVLPLDERVDIDVISRLYAIKYRLISLVSFVFYLSKRNIFIFGNDRGYFFKVLRSISILKQIVVVNDVTRPARWAVMKFSTNGCWIGHDAVPCRQLGI